MHRKITDHALTVRPNAVQWADGTIDDGAIEPPQIFVFDLGEGSPLNSDQARGPNLFKNSFQKSVGAEVAGCS